MSNLSAKKPAAKEKAKKPVAKKEAPKKVEKKLINITEHAHLIKLVIIYYSHLDFFKIEFLALEVENALEDIVSENCSFLRTVVQKWEAAAQQFEALSIKTTIK